MARRRDHRRGPQRFRWLRFGVLVLVVLAVLLGFLFMMQRSFMYFPDADDAGPAAAHFDDASDVDLKTADGLSLSAWRIEPAKPSEWAVLYLPGNAGNRVGRVEVGQTIADQGFTVLMVDYRGYGGNPGKPSQEGLVRDVRAAAEYLADSGFSPDRTLYVGESIGTGVAMQLAVSHPPAGLVLRSPFTSMADLVKHTTKLPLGPLLRDRFDSARVADRVGCPVVVLAGSEDEVVPAAQSRALSERFGVLHSYVEVPGVGHNDGIWFGEFLAHEVADLRDTLTK